MNTIDEFKASLVAKIEKRQEDKIIEKQTAEALIRFINMAQSVDDANTIYNMGTRYQNTGFHFDFCKDKIDQDTIFYFEKNEELSVKAGENGITHKLIIGDNYKALLNLMIEYKGGIDVIYIDPPYGKDNMGNAAKTNYENNITRDSLLSSLCARLLLAQYLLADTGIIFCSIDDTNQAYVKCLFDDIFGEKNFLLNMCVNRTSDIASNYTISQHEYVLCYTNDIEKYALNSNEKYTYSRGTVGNENQTMPVITFPAGLKCVGLPDGKYETTRKIENGNENVENLTPIYIKNGVLEKDIKLKARWRSSNDMRNFFKNECRPTKAKINGVIEDIYFENDKFVPTIKKKTYEKIHSLFLDNTRGSKTLEDLGMKGVFSFPKSLPLMEYLLSFAPQDAKILDFYAGSGTTGHAVMELNKDDGGHRQFILVQLDERLNLDDASDSDKPIIENEIKFLEKLNLPLNIASLTNERLRRVMTGKGYDGSCDFKWLTENSAYGDGLDVYNIANVSAFEREEGKSAFDMIDERLYGIDRLDVNEKIEWVCSKFELTCKNVESEKEWRKRVEGKKDAE